MKQAILNALSALNISDYSMTEQQRSSAELFFIKKRLDMRRVKDTHEYSVTVYNVFEEDGKKFRGSSTVILFPGTEAAEITRQFKDAYNAAGYVKNPYYDLYEGPKEAVKEVPSTLSAHTLSQNAELMAAALFAAGGCMAQQRGNIRLPRPYFDIRIHRHGCIIRQIQLQGRVCRAG